MQIGQAFLDLLHSLKGRFEQFHVLCQFFQKQFDIFRRDEAQKQAEEIFNSPANITRRSEDILQLQDGQIVG
jgi:hypothetical protein